MSLITRMRRQKAVLWAYVGNNDYGQPTVDAPIEIKCRFEDVQEEFIDMVGAKVISDAKIYLDREVALHSVIWVGRLLDLPVDPTNLLEVRKYSALPNLRNTETLRMAMLMNLKTPLSLA